MYAIGVAYFHIEESRVIHFEGFLVVCKQFSSREGD
jgi:hypothetical protein